MASRKRPRKKKTSPGENPTTPDPAQIAAIPDPKVGYGGVYTVKYVALLLSVSPATVYRLVDSGQLAAVYIGRCVRIPRLALEDFLAAPGDSLNRKPQKMPPPAGRAVAGPGRGLNPLRTGNLGSR